MDFFRASDTPLRPPHNVFFAAVPPPAVGGCIARAWQAVGTGDDFRHSTLHMTLLNVFQRDRLDQRLVDQASRAADLVESRPFSLVFDRVVTFGRGHEERAIVLATDGEEEAVGALAAELHARGRAAGLFLPRLRKVVAHVTLAYGAGFAGIRSLAAPIRWHIDGFHLIDSLQGEGRHVSLGEWSLNPEHGPRLTAVRAAPVPQSPFGS